MKHGIAHRRLTLARALALGAALRTLPSEVAFAQTSDAPGSVGGSLGKQDKSASGGEEPRKAASPKIRKPRIPPANPESRAAVRPSSNPLGGQWRWQANCPIGGDWEGGFRISPLSGGSFEGAFTSGALVKAGSADAGGPDAESVGLPGAGTITKGRLDGDQFSFERDIDSVVQQWSGTIEQSHMTGTIVAIFGLRCTWSASRS